VKPAVEQSGDGRVLVRTGKVELGQGLHTALAQIAADALGLPLAQIELLPVDTEDSPDQGVTSGSLSIQDAGAALKQACEAWRARWPARTVAPRQGGSDGAPRAPWVGRSVAQRGLAERLAGAPSFIHDLRPDGLLHGRVLHPPQLQATLLACDTGPTRRLPGVRQVLRSGSLLGVIAETSAQADAAAEQLAAACRWQTGPLPDEDADELPGLPASSRTICEGARDDQTPVAGMDKATATATDPVRSLSAVYRKPWIAHASIAPSCALACWTDGALRVWSHSQGIFNLRRDLALAFARDPERVRVTHVPGAGCYGHNGADDVAFDAAWLAQAEPGRTVTVRWSRADELSQSPQGPAMRVALQAGVDADGRIVHWQHALWSPGHSRRPGRNASPALLGAWQIEPAHAVPPSIDMPLAVGGGAERNAVPGYDFAAVTVRVHSVHTRRRSSALRSLGAFANIFAAESFIDEIAEATGQCPLALRQRHLQHDPRALAVLQTAVHRSGWTPARGPVERPRPDAVGHGMAVARYKQTGAWCAVVAQVHAGATLQVQRLTVAVDVGRAVNPDGVANQIEGGAIQATSWTLKEHARVHHAGWDDYPILRFTEVPAVDVIVMPSTDASLGAGEASLGPTAAAIANALHDALGVRVRDLPLTPERIIAAMETTV
jgi:nicotinate dehydrogenase subunit B